MFNILDNAIILQTEDQLPRFVQSTVSFFNSGYSIFNLGYCLLRLILSPLSAISMQVRNSVLIFSFPVRYVDMKYTVRYYILLLITEVMEHGVINR